MIAQDDLLVGGINGLPVRLVKGTEGQELAIVGGHVVWATNPGGYRTAAQVTAAITGYNYISMSSALTGFTVGDNEAISATDTVLVAFGKIQSQINNSAGGGSGTWEPVIADGLATQVWLGTKTWATLDTALVAENGSLYFTEPRVLATSLTGLSTASGGPLEATDSIVGALGKLENRTALNDAKDSFPGFGTSGSEACVGNDARLSDARPASDVSAWAKAAAKPTYEASEVGALANPMVAQDDLILGGVSGAPTRLAKGTEGQIPTIVGGHVVWTTPTELTNPMTALGDIIVGGADGVPTRRAQGSNGNLWGVSGGAVGYFSPATFGISSGGGQGFTVITGMDPTGATDSTSAVEAAIAALPTGGGVLLIPDPQGQGGYKFNITINRGGVWIFGPGLSDNGGLNYIRPWNNNLPVVKFGSAAGNIMVRHSGIRDMYLYGSNVGKSGLVFASGANYCRAFNVNVRNFNGAHVTFINDTDAQPTQFNLLDHFCVESSATIADNGTDYPIGLLFEDRHSSGGGWTTANYASNGNINVGNGYSYVVESAAASLTNIYIDQEPGHGILIKRSYYYEPFLTTTNVITDTGGSVGSVAMILDLGYDLQGNTATGHISFMGGLNPDMSMGDNVFYAAGHTTGSITSGQNTLTVASLTGFAWDRTVIVRGAGVGGKNLIANIESISGMVVTLSVAASTTVSTVDVMYGDSTGEKSFIGYGGNAYLSPGGIRLVPTGKDGVAARGEKGQIFRCGATGGVAPFNSTDFAIDFKNGSGIHFLHDITGGTSVSSISQSGNTVTVNTGSSHGAMVGDLVTLFGVREPGINGTYAIASVPSTSSVTYTSSVSQTLAGVTGSPLAIFTNSVRIVGGQVVLSGYAGLGMKNHLGATTKVLYQNLANSSMYLQVSDPASGSLSMIAGTAVSTGTAFAWQANGATKMRLLGDATLQLRPGASPANDATYGQIYFSSSDNRWHIKDTSNNDGVVLSTATSAITATTAAPTATSSSTAVMMGCNGTITPSQSTRLLVTISGQMANSVAGSGATLELRYGAGIKPSNAASASGSVVGIAQTITSVTAAQKSGFTITGILTGLTRGTAYWLDASLLAITSGSASITGVTITAVEI